MDGRPDAVFGGQLAGLLNGPAKELVSLWRTRDRSKSSVAYFMDLPSA